MEDADWAQVSAGPLAGGMLKGLRSPQGLAQLDQVRNFRACFVPINKSVCAGSISSRSLDSGHALADDMGLGKTIQVLSLMLILKRQENAHPKPSLLVAPASLLANWAAEIQRFAPD